MARYSTVLFDLDGTLIDSIQLILDSYHHTLAAHGLPPRDDRYWLAGIGTPLSVQFREWAGDEEQLQAMIATYRAFNLAHHDARIRIYPGVAACVTALARGGIRLGVVTSKNRAGALRGLDLVGLRDAMEVIVAADDVTQPKPHPEPVHLAAARLGISAAGALFVGDSLHDMHAGREAGAGTGAVLWGPFDRAHLEPAAPDYWLAAPADLTALVLGG